MRLSSILEQHQENDSRVWRKKIGCTFGSYALIKHSMQGYFLSKYRNGETRTHTAERNISLVQSWDRLMMQSKAWKQTSLEYPNWYHHTWSGISTPYDFEMDLVTSEISGYLRSPRPPDFLSVWIHARWENCRQDEIRSLAQNSTFALTSPEF